MATGTPTTIRGIPTLQPDRSESPDVTRDFNAIAASLDDAPTDISGTTAQRDAIASPKDKTYFFNYQTGVLSRFRQGVGWTDINPKSSAASIPSLRRLGTASTDAAAGNDSRLFDQRVPQNGSVTTAKIADEAVTADKIEDQENWITTSVNSFTGLARYMKDSLGFVHFRQEAVTNSVSHGVPAGGVLPYDYFYLPADYRPAVNLYFPFMRTNPDAATEGRDYVLLVRASNGAVQLWAAPAVNGIGNGWSHTFGAIHFKAGS